MNRFHIMLLLALGVVTSFACQADAVDAPHISVMGSAVKEFEPDVTRWHLSLRSEAKSADEAAKSHAQTLAKLLQQLKAKGVAEKTIKTQSMSLSENWNYVNGKRFQQGYVATATIQFESTIDSYSQFWAELSRIEGLSIQGTSFDLKDRIRAHQQVRKEALLAARDKAKAMAEVLDAALGKVYVIEDLNWEDDVHLPVQNVAMMRSAKAEVMAADAALVSPGTLEIRSRVKVIFLLK